MNLHAGGSFFGIFGVDLVETEDFAGGRVEFVVVDLDRGQGRVKGEFDVGDPRRVSEGLGCGRGHGDCGVCVAWSEGVQQRPDGVILLPRSICRRGGRSM